MAVGGMDPQRAEIKYFIDIDDQENQLVIGRSGRRRRTGQNDLAGKKRNTGVKVGGKKGKKGDKKGDKGDKDEGGKGGKKRNEKSMSQSRRKKKKKKSKGEGKKPKGAKDLAFVGSHGNNATEMDRLADELAEMNPDSHDYFSTVARRALLLGDEDLMEHDELLVHWVFPSANCLEEYYDKEKISRKTVLAKSTIAPTPLRRAISKVWRTQIRGCVHIPKGFTMIQFCLAVLECLAIEKEFSSSTMDEGEDIDEPARLTSTRALMKEVVQSEGGRKDTIASKSFRDPDLSTDVEENEDEMEETDGEELELESEEDEEEENSEEASEGEEDSEEEDESGSESES